MTSPVLVVGALRNVGAEAGHAGRNYNLTGSEGQDYWEAAQIMRSRTTHKKKADHVPPVCTGLPGCLDVTKRNLNY